MLAIAGTFAAHRPGVLCPIDRGQLLDTLAALLIGRKPRVPAKTVCTECKNRGVTCVFVADGIPYLGPVTHAGCGALCPAHHRGCYGCFGPAVTPNTAALIPVLRRDGMPKDGGERVFSTFNVTAFTAEGNDRLPLTPPAAPAHFPLAPSPESRPSGCPHGEAVLAW